jgi:hypothetical protein
MLESTWGVSEIRRDTNMTIVTAEGRGSTLPTHAPALPADDDRASTLPSPAPSFGDLPAITVVDEDDLITDGPSSVSPPPLPIGAGVIPAGAARHTIVGAMLDVYRSLYRLEQIAGAIIRGADLGDEVALPVEGAVEVAKQAVRNAGTLLIQAARGLDASAKVTALVMIVLTCASGSGCASAAPSPARTATAADASTQTTVTHADWYIVGDRAP